MMHRTERSGFTLIEMVVVIGLLGILTTLGVTAFIAITDHWSEIHTESELELEVRSIFEAVTRDLDDMTAPMLAEHPIRGESEDYVEQDVNKPFWNRPVTTDRLAIDLESVPGPSGLISGGTVQYELDPSDPALPVVRRVVLDGDIRSEQTVAEGVVSLDVTYKSPDTGEWAQEWTSSGAPEAIAINVTVRSPRNPGFQLSRRKVALIPGH